MNVSIKEYANIIAKELGGEAKEVTKTNGIILHGVLIRQGNETVVPNVYIDDLYEQEISINEAILMVKKRVEQARENITLAPFDFDINDYEVIKPKLSARLLNANTNTVEVYRSATEYGFDDLIVVPIIVFKDDGTGLYSTKVSQNMLDKWGASADEVIEAALEQMQYVIESMFGMMTIVSTPNHINGAIAGILAQKELNEKFPDGYWLIPSSIHEMIVWPYDESMDENAITSVIGEVNTDVLNKEEYLGSKPYLIGRKEM